MPCRQCDLFKRFKGTSEESQIPVPRYQGHVLIDIYKRCMKLLMIILWPCQETDNELDQMEKDCFEYMKTLIAYQVHPLTLRTPFEDLEEFHVAHIHPNCKHEPHLYTCMEDVCLKFYLTHLYSNPSFSPDCTPTFPTNLPREKILEKYGVFWGTYKYD